VKVVVGSIAAILVAVGLVLGIEAAVSGPGRADVGTVAGVLKMTGVMRAPSRCSALGAIYGFPARD
jgi:hypothetical protein